jgi:hypothetical protein
MLRITDECVIIRVTGEDTEELKKFNMAVSWAIFKHKIILRNKTSQKMR